MSHQPLSFLKNIHSLAFDKCIPWFVTIELNQACNLKCVHCYNFDRSQKISIPLKELESSKVLQLIDEFKSLGTLMIAFSGGEPMLYKNLFAIIEHTTKSNLASKLKTNACLIDSNAARKLKQAGLKSADVSVYGASPFSHEVITLQNESFKKTIEGIRNLKNQNIDVDINYIIHQKNFHELEDMINLANELKCHYNFATEITDRYDHSSDSKNLEITSEQYKTILNSKYREYFFEINEESNFQCECARTVCAIGHQGNVYPCIGAPVISGNIHQDSLKNIWNNSDEFKKIRELKRNDFKDCVECSLQSFCSRSSGSAFVNTGNYTAKNPSHCKEAKVRFENSQLSF